MHTIYINIGSNQGDRMALIESAVALISEAFAEAVGLRRSDYIESEPWGYESTHPFLNLGVAIDMEREPQPLDVLDRLQAIERQVADSPHRNPDGSYRDRPIDIDIIAIDLVRMRSPRLTLPHPRAARRAFVMTPMRQLAPTEVLQSICL